MNRDWIGNSRSAFSAIGARNFAQEEREEHDYYATEPKATRLLLDVERFTPYVWEPACGEGHMARVLEEYGYKVYASDIIDRGYGHVLDFLSCDCSPLEQITDIITNPPYKYAKEFVKHAMDLLPDGGKCAMFLKLQFLEGKARRKLFEKHPPKIVYVCIQRQLCAKNGHFENYPVNPPVCYAWFVWEKGFKGEPIIRWV